MKPERLTKPASLFVVAVTLSLAGAAFAEGGWPSNGPQFQGAGAAVERPATNLDQLTRWERQDFGVAPTDRLHGEPMEAPTPARIPGGQVITTKGVLELLQGKTGVPVVLLDVLGGPQQLPRAVSAAFAAEPGSFRDGTEQQFAQLLNQITGGNKQFPLVLYCQGRTCWMSYNASLRAIHLGYTNVLWYRGGLQAWQRAGLPLVPASATGYPQGSDSESGYPRALHPSDGYPQDAYPAGGYPQNTYPPAGYPNGFQPQDFQGTGNGAGGRGPSFRYDGTALTPSDDN